MARESREEREARKKREHDDNTAIIKAAAERTAAPELTSSELRDLMTLYPGAVRSTRPVAGGKFEVHFHRGRRPRGV